MKKNRKLLLICIAIPLGVGALSAWLTRGSMLTFEMVQKPPLSPPGWLFPVVWTILYILMGIASWLVLTSDTSPERIRRAMIPYIIQLVFNFFWSILFFNLERYLLAFFWLAVLWVLVLKTTVRFYRLSPLAGLLMLPYLVWVTFAGYLNLGIWWLN